MTTLYVILLTKALLLTSLLSNVITNDIKDEAENILPLIWPSIGTDKSYYIMFQMEIFGTFETITVEEWASFEKQLFRLDLISADKRITYLTNGKTGEIFCYQQFSCELLDSNSRESNIVGNFLRGYTYGKTLAYGLGPLWLWAKKEAATVEPMLATSKKNRRHDFLDDFRGYQITFKWPPNREIEYDLRFYFSKEKDSFVQAVDWVITSGKKQMTAARAKLITLDSTWPVSDSVFDLPVGYGCVRSYIFDHSIQDYGKLEILHEGGPNQATLEITTSKPKDKLARSWNNHRYTVRLMCGALKSNALIHSYYVILTQAQDSESPRIKRIKRVWSALKTSEQALVYTIDEETKDCKVKHVNYKDYVKLDFPGQKEEEEKEKKTLIPMSLNTEMIFSLINDNSDYHLIREEMGSTLDRPTKAYYEKRIVDYEIKTGDTIVWAGPVSIVKKFITFSQFPNKDFNIIKQNVTSSGNNHHLTVIIFFYSNDLSKILYKAVIDLVDNEEVDVNFMHKQMDISSCFTEEQKEDIIIKYPIESQLFDMGKKLSSVQDIIRESFCLQLFNSTPIQPLQVSDIEITFDNFFMYLKMTLLDLPLTQIFEFKANTRLAVGSDSSALIEKMSTNVNKCATSCDYYNCFRFSFDQAKLRCRIEVKKDGARTEQSNLNDMYVYVESKVESAWLSYDENGGRTHLRPQSVVELFNEFVTYENRNADAEEDKFKDNVPLRLRIQRNSILIELRPISVYSDMDSMNEFVKKEKLDSNGTTNSVTIDKAEDLSSNLRVQYNILIESREFRQNLPAIEGSLSYENCEQICEDNDCRSFSYCVFKKECRITNLQKMKDIQPVTEYEPRCGIFALDYVSKFENFGPALGSPVEAIKIIEEISVHDCALACMEEPVFNCQGFYHCQPTNSKSKCIMQDKHIEDTAGVSANLWLHSTINSANKMETNEKCTFYSRSYLAQFDKYYEKMIQFPAGLADDSVVDVINGLGAESCARKCIERSCFAFNICLEPNSETSFTEVCQLAKQIIKKSYLTNRKRCTTLVLSDKSQFNIQKATLEGSEPDKRALDKATNGEVVVIDPKEQEALKNDLNSGGFDFFSKLNQTRLLSGSHWLSKLLSNFVGIFLGVGLASLWRKKDKIYIVFSRFSNGRTIR